MGSTSSGHLKSLQTNGCSMLPNLQQFLEEQMYDVCVGGGVGMFPWPHAIHLPLSKSQGHSHHTRNPSSPLYELFLR